MEYKIYNKLHKIFGKRNKAKNIFSNIFYIFGISIIIIPLPFSVPTGLFLLICGFLLKIRKVKNIKYVIKIKKSIIYLIRNIKNKKTIKRKIKDIKYLYKKSIK